MYRLLGFGLLLGLLLVVGSVAEACGDKLLALSRGVRFQRSYFATRPASILIYVSHHARNVRNPQLQATLRQAGHKLRSVEGSGELEQTLKSGRYDLVLADPDDASAVAQQARSAPSNPTVIPVFSKPTKTELAAAEKQFGYYLPGKPIQDLLVIEIAMKDRARPRRSSSREVRRSRIEPRIRNG